MLKSNALLFFPLAAVEASLDTLDKDEGAFFGENSMLCRGFSIEKSNCLFTGLLSEGGDSVRVGVPLFTFLEGEDIGPTDRGIDLRGEEFRYVFLGDIARGGRLIRPFRAALTRSVGSGIVPGMTTVISGGASGFVC